LLHFKVVALISAISFAAQLSAADQASDPVSAFVRSEMQKQRIPGLTLLVSKNGNPIRTEGYGVSNLELNVAAKPETIFQSGSVGKQFTATAVMMLVEAGKLGLEDPLTKYFPEAPSSWRQVTVRELLSHTAGFTDYPKNSTNERTTRRMSFSRSSERFRSLFFAGYQLEIQ
jgi:CubicO group peptidase (beta-lactamase class C family)